MTQVAHGLDPDGLLLLDVVVSGVVPKSLADADLLWKLKFQIFSSSSSSRTSGSNMCRWGPAGSLWAPRSASCKTASRGCCGILHGLHVQPVARFTPCETAYSGGFQCLVSTGNFL